MHPARVLPKPVRDIPELYGVEPSYSIIHSLHLAEGKFFDEGDDATSATVCVVGGGAKVNLLGYGPACGKFVKVNDSWMEVIGVLREQIMAGAANSGASMLDVALATRNGSG
jgi:putative ABC transport system permease protein